MTTKTISLKELSEKILGRVLPVIPVDLDEFFEEDDDGNWVIDSDTRIQVREEEVNFDFIEKKVQYVLNTGNESHLDPLVVVKMPDGSYKLLDGSHTASIKIELGHVASDAIILDFEKDLGGSISYAKMLGNLLNKPDKEKQAYTINDVKNSLYEFMAEKEENGEDPKPTEEEYNWFVSLFPDVSRAQLGQFVSYTPAGGRQKPAKSYSKEQLKNIAKTYESMERFDGYSIVGPYNLGHAQNVALSKAVLELTEKNTNKVVILLYCKSNSQVKAWVDKDGNPTKKRTNLLQKFNNVSNRFNIEIVVEMLKYK